MVTWRVSPGSRAHGGSASVATRAQQFPAGPRQGTSFQFPVTETLGRSLGRCGVSAVSAATIYAAHRQSTHALYHAKWWSFCCHCSERQKDPLHPSIRIVLSYLQHLQQLGLAHNTILSHITTLSACTGNWSMEQRWADTPWWLDGLWATGQRIHLIGSWFNLGVCWWFWWHSLVSDIWASLYCLDEIAYVEDTLSHSYSFHQTSLRPPCFMYLSSIERPLISSLRTLVSCLRRLQRSRSPWTLLSFTYSLTRLRSSVFSSYVLFMCFVFTLSEPVTSTVEIALKVTN